MAAVYANSSNQVAALKELYDNPTDYLQDLVYAENPLLALIPKDESSDGFAGKYIPVPIQYGVPQGRSHTFANALSGQTAPGLDSFFVYVIQDYEIVTITNLLMEQTKSNAGAFIDEAKLIVDGGFRALTNNIAFELFGDGSGTRGRISSADSSGAPTYVITLTNAQQVVNFEVGMTLVSYAYSSGTISSISATQAQITDINRSTGVITVLATGSSSDWSTSGRALGVYGDIISGAVSTGTSLCLSGLAAWVPTSAPSSTAFWGVDRTTDVTRLGGLRYDASSYTIEEGMTNALALVNREGGKPDLCIMDFSSYAALVNALGAKVQYVQVKHDEVEVAFEGITFQSAYGRVTVLADRSCPPQTAYLLTMSTWKLRSLGKVPHILTYGIEGLDGLRVGTADALEIRIGYYGNLICSAPGRNCVVTLSA